MRRCRSLPCTTLAAAIRVTSRNHLPSAASRILVTLRLHPMKHLTSLQERLLSPATSRHHTNSRQTIITHIPRATRRQTNHRSLRRVTNDGCVSARRTRKLPTITRLKLKVTHQRSLRNLPQRQNITNLNRSFSAKTQLLPNKHALSSHGVTRNAVLETNQHQRCTTTRIMRKAFNHTTYRVIEEFLRRNGSRILCRRNSLVR